MNEISAYNKSVLWNLFIGVGKKCVRHVTFTTLKKEYLNESQQRYREECIQHDIACKLIDLFREDMKKDIKKEEFQDRIEYRYRMVVMTERELEKYVYDVIEATANAIIEDGLTVDKIKGGIID